MHGVLVVRFVTQFPEFDKWSFHHLHHPPWLPMVATNLVMLSFPSVRHLFMPDCQETGCLSKRNADMCHWENESLWSECFACNELTFLFLQGYNFAIIFLKIILIECSQI